MTLEHGIIRDLLPLYADGVCGPESRQAVEKHLAGCPACREEYEKLKNADTFGATPTPAEKQRAAALKRIRRALNWKRVLVACLAVAVTLGAVTGAGMWLNSATVRMPAETMTSVEYLPDTQEGWEAFNRIVHQTMEKDGQGEIFVPAARGDFHGGLELVTQGKFADMGMMFYGVLAGDRYVLVATVRATYWDALFHGDPRERHGCVTLPSTWEDWKPAICSQLLSAANRDEPEQLGYASLEEIEALLPPPRDQDCIFDEVYFFCDCRQARTFFEEKDPGMMEEFLERLTADGDAVRVWQREP